MTLYEATNGFIGESYVRCYVWACDEETALGLATIKFKEYAGCDRIRQCSNITLKVLMYEHSREFVTEVSDSGWEIKE